MRILTAFAHPDDESFGPGGALAKYARRGARLAGVWLTRGEGGESNLDPPPPPDQLEVIRAADLDEAASILGYQDVELLGYPDGGLPDLPEKELQGVVFDAIAKHRPDVVITFGPGGISGHPDHIALSAATTAAFHAARAQGDGVRELYYVAVLPEIATERNLSLSHLPDGNPNTFIDVAEAAAIHLSALACHARHIADAEEFLMRLEQEPLMVATFYRAWPEVAEGGRVVEFLEDGDG